MKVHVFAQNVVIEITFYWFEAGQKLVHSDRTTLISIELLFTGQTMQIVQSFLVRPWIAIELLCSWPTMRPHLYLHYGPKKGPLMSLGSYFVGDVLKRLLLHYLLVLYQLFISKRQLLFNIHKYIFKYHMSFLPISCSRGIIVDHLLFTSDTFIIKLFSVGLSNIFAIDLPLK